MTLLDALIGFLGAAFGAALGALIGLKIERDRRAREDHFRYSPENRAAFVSFLEACDERAWAVGRQVEAAWEWSQGRKPEDEIPTLGPSDDVRKALDRILNTVAEERLVSYAGRLLYRSVIWLDHSNYVSGRRPIDPVTDPGWLQDWAEYELGVDLFRRTSQREVGAVPEPREPWRDRLRRLKR